jgi:arsenate reductase-like glutaredoxin family protein
MCYENITQKVLFDNAVFTTFMSGEKYDVIVQNINCSRENNVRTLVFRNKVHYQNATPLQNSILKDPPSENAIRRWLQQFSALHMPENTKRETEYRLGILRVTKGAHVEVV